MKLSILWLATAVVIFARPELTLVNPGRTDIDRADAKGKLSAISEFLGNRPDSDSADALVLVAVIQLAGEPTKVIELERTGSPTVSKAFKVNCAAADLSVDFDATVEATANGVNKIDGKVSISFDPGKVAEEPTTRQTSQRIGHRIHRHQAILFRGIGTDRDRISLALVRT